MGWLKWRLASIVFCDRQIPTKLKKYYTQQQIHQQWPMEKNVGQLGKKHIQKISVLEMKISRWMCGKSKTGKHRIKNERIREHRAVASIGDN